MLAFALNVLDLFFEPSDYINCGPRHRFISMHERFNGLNEKLNEMMVTLKLEMVVSKLRDYTFRVTALQDKYNRFLKHPGNSIEKNNFINACDKKSISDVNLWLYNSIVTDKLLYERMLSNDDAKLFIEMTQTILNSFLEAAILEVACESVNNHGNPDLDSLMNRTMNSNSQRFKLITKQLLIGYLDLESSCKRKIDVLLELPTGTVKGNWTDCIDGSNGGKTHDAKLVTCFITLLTGFKAIYQVRL